MKLQCSFHSDSYDTRAVVELVLRVERPAPENLGSEMDDITFGYIPTVVLPSRCPELIISPGKVAQRDD